VIVAPGGGFHMLSIDNEGEAVAKWLNSQGVTAFVLKYRLLETGADFPLQMMRYLANLPSLCARPSNRCARWRPPMARMR
jgi:acetyl esterase/lipase